MNADQRHYAVFLLKGLIGYVIGSGPLFGALAFVAKIPPRQLIQPYLLLLILTTVAVLMIYDARKYTNDPTALSYRASLAVLLLWASCILVFVHYGVKIRILRADAAPTFLWSGIASACFGAVAMFYSVRRKALQGKIGPR